MNLFGTSRFTALLAAVALSGTAGTFWWALETRSDMKAAASNRVLSRGVPVKAGGRAPRWKDEHAAKTDGPKTDGAKTDSAKTDSAKFDTGKPEAGKFELSKFELMGKSERPRPPNLARASTGGDEDADRAPDRSIGPRLANYPIPAPGYENPGQGPAAPGQGSSNPGTRSGRADMPLPAMPTRLDAAPAPMPSWPVSGAAAPAAFTSPIPVQAPPQQPPPAEMLRRQAREPRPEPPPAAAARKPKTPSFYTEQYIEQGEFRYRSRPCEPPNMPDVCFMPQADRHPIVVAKP